MKIFPSIILTLLVSACSIVPEQVRVENEDNLVTYQNAKNSPELNKDRAARWGGVIAEIENRKDFTVIEVVNIELTSSTKPQNINESAGRFRIYYKGLLDPMIYQKGKDVTALGTVSATEQGTIGELEYDFPVLLASGIYLWQDVERIDVRVKHDPFMNPYYGSYYPYPYPYGHSRTVIIKNPKPTPKAK